MQPSPATRYSLILRLHDRSDARAWSDFVEIYEPLVHRMMLRAGLQPADALEQTQEVMAAVTEAINRWRPDPQRGKFRTWLFRISRNILADFYRQSQRQPVTGLDDEQLGAIHPHDSSSFDPEFERQVFVVAAQQVRPQVQPATWAAFWQTAVERQPIEEVARNLSLSPGTVYVARCRVMKKLQQAVRSFLNSEIED